MVTTVRFINFFIQISFICMWQLIIGYPDFRSGDGLAFHPDASQNTHLFGLDNIVSYDSSYPDPEAYPKFVKLSAWKHGRSIQFDNLWTERSDNFKAADRSARIKETTYETFNCNIA